jgi:hypothetical protein
VDGALRRAKARLDRLDLYPRPVRVARVRLVVAPWLFRLPWFRRFDGYATHFVIFLRRPDAGDDLVTHELCHVWQMQHHPIAMPLSYLYRGYERNPYELEARRAVGAQARS